MAENLKFQVQTYGCKVNSYDSGLIEKRFLARGHQMADDSCDTQVYILNTCAVTAEATKEALREVRKIRLRDPNGLIVVTGCSAQVDTEKFVQEARVDLIVANSHKSELESLIQNKLLSRDSERLFKSNIFKKEDLEEGGGLDESHTRAFLKIQDGCNSFCTFCVIPFARGKSRSLTIDHLRGRVEEILAQGIKEIVLTGVHIGDYEFGLENLVEDLLLKTRVPRLRLTSLEPVEISDRLLELYQDPRLCAHFHMSIQSATTSVLSGMKRKYDAQTVERALWEIHKRVSGAYVGMDVIAGFPGESEEDFCETYERLAQLPWTRIHVFPYSERPGTFAVRLSEKNTPMSIHRRADQLTHLSRSRFLTEAQKQVGKVKKVLVFDNGRGLSRDYWNILLRDHSGNLELKNKEFQMEIIGMSQTVSRGRDPQLLAQLIHS